MSESLFDERTRVCPECEGDGVILPQNGEPVEWCAACRGAGYVRVKVEAA